MLLVANATRFDLDDTGALFDLRVRGEHIVEVGARLARNPEERVLDARGGAVLPGLHDHHIHLLAFAAAEQSVRCGPPAVVDRAGLRRALAAHPGESWLRGIGYDETVAGELDARSLDALIDDRPARIQHRSGAMWVLNTAAIRALALDRYPEIEGIERDAKGSPTGVLFRLDGWLRQRLEATRVPHVRDVSTLLARYGVTGVTDASATNDAHTARLLGELSARGELLQHVRVMGDESLAGPGELKVLLDEASLPPLEELVGSIGRAHGAGRGVAFHCVTRTELVFALAALDAAGCTRADRIEHAAVVPDAALALLAKLRPTIVTQPGFVHAHGDRYRRDVPACEHAELYRYAALREAGVPVAASSDAPYGPANPWLIMRAAVGRTTSSGVVLGNAEGVSPEAVLRGFCSRADDPGGAMRTLRPGEVADLCVLRRPWQDVRSVLDERDVIATICGGAVTFEEGRAC